jgi:type VII secretion-associated protein (TIGR03931 family)
LDTGTVRSHLIEVGPNSVRRLCCGGGTVADAEAERTAFETIDDHVALVDFQPIAVASLWKDVLGSVDCGTSEQVTVFHPSWWSPARVGVVSAAARTLVGDGEIRPRSWLLAQASPSKSERDTLVVEIADRFVVLTGAAMATETRRRDQLEVAGAVARAVLTMASDTTVTVVIDAPATVRGAGTLAAPIAERLRACCGMNVVLVDDIRMRRLAGELKSRDRRCVDTGPHAPAGGDRRRRALKMLVLFIGIIISVVAVQRDSEPDAQEQLPTTFAVEGHVALEVPAQWPMRRVVVGPGSARLQITSPKDPEVALHVTQSRVALSSLNATAEFLKSAIDAAPAGVFVDFNPTDRSAGRPAVTYREVRAGHDIRWAVWVDKAVRVSIGCQSRSGRSDVVRPVCDLAVRSARVLD